MLKGRYILINGFLILGILCIAFFYIHGLLLSIISLINIPIHIIYVQLIFAEVWIQIVYNHGLVQSYTTICNSFKFLYTRIIRLTIREVLCMVVVFSLGLLHTPSVCTPGLLILTVLYTPIVHFFGLLHHLDTTVFNVLISLRTPSVFILGFLFLTIIYSAILSMIRFSVISILDASISGSVALKWVHHNALILLSNIEFYTDLDSILK